jgi:hypothetical protein
MIAVQLQKVIVVVVEKVAVDCRIQFVAPSDHVTFTIFIDAAPSSTTPSSRTTLNPTTHPTHQPTPWLKASILTASSSK